MSRSNDIASITSSVLDGVTKAEVGLGNVDNTADTAKPVSTAQQSAIDLKANIASPTFTGTVSGVDAGHITTGTLGNTVQDNITRLGNVITHYTFSEMNITATNPWVFSTSADFFCFKFQDIVWFQLGGNDGDQVTGNVAANYQIGNIGNTDLRPSANRLVSAVSMEFQGETNSYFNIYANGNIELLYPNEEGDSTHRFLMQGFYKL